MSRCWTLVFVMVLALVGAEPGAAQQSLPPGEEPSPTAFSRLEKAGDSSRYPDVPYLVALDETVTRVDERGVSEVEATVLYKILSATGCLELAVLR